MRSIGQRQSGCHRRAEGEGNDEVFHESHSVLQSKCAEVVGDAPRSLATAERAINVNQGRLHKMFVNAELSWS